MKKKIKKRDKVKYVKKKKKKLKRKCVVVIKIIIITMPFWTPWNFFETDYIGKLIKKSYKFSLTSVLFKQYL